MRTSIHALPPFDKTAQDALRFSAREGGISSSPSSLRPQGQFSRVRRPETCDYRQYLLSPHDGGGRVQPPPLGESLEREPTLCPETLPWNNRLFEAYALPPAASIISGGDFSGRRRVFLGRLPAPASWWGWDNADPHEGYSPTASAAETRPSGRAGPPSPPSQEMASLRLKDTLLRVFLLTSRARKINCQALGAACERIGR
jgi:hypothetical protein